MLRLLPIFSVLLIASSCVSGEDITITITQKYNNIEVAFSGKREGKITPADALEFGLYPEGGCKKRIARKFSNGVQPDSCYLAEPTPWKLYPTYNWTEVTSTYRIRSVSLVQKNEDHTIVRERILENMNSQNVTLRLLESTATVYDSILHKAIGKSPLEGTVIVVLNGEVSHVHAWGSEEEKKYQRKLPVMGVDELILPPRTRLNSAAKALRQIAEYEVTYENVVDGFVAANFNPKYKNHHFHAVDVRPLTLGVNRVYKERLIICMHFRDTINIDNTKPVVIQ